MTHEQYLEHLNKHITSRVHDVTFNELLRNHQKAFEILTSLNLDPA